MDWDDFEDDEDETKLFDYDCRHGCNGDCVVLGYDNGVCGITCHPGLHYDEQLVLEREARLEEMGRCCYDGIDCTTGPRQQPQTRPLQRGQANR